MYLLQFFKGYFVPNRKTGIKVFWYTKINVRHFFPLLIQYTYNSYDNLVDGPKVKLT